MSPGFPTTSPLLISVYLSTYTPIQPPTHTHNTPHTTPHPQHPPVVIDEGVALADLVVLVDAALEEAGHARMVGEHEPRHLVRRLHVA
jgi:hypothetical protein